MTTKLLDWSKLNGAQQQKFAMKEYYNYNVGDPVYINKKLAGFVVYKYDRRKTTGEQAYVVSNSPKGTPANQIKHIAVLYQGSSSPLSGDGQKDWFDNDLPIAKDVLQNSGSENYHGTPTPQLRSSARDLKTIFGKYYNAKISVYGHSLGSMDGQYAVSSITNDQLKRLEGAFLYEGPNVFSLLSSKQKKMALKLGKHNVHVYADLKDVVTMLELDYKKGHVGNLKFLKTKFLNNIVNQHMMKKTFVVKNGELETISYKEALKDAQHAWLTYVVELGVVELGVVGSASFVFLKFLAKEAMGAIAGVVAKKVFTEIAKAAKGAFVGTVNKVKSFFSAVGKDAQGFASEIEKIFLDNPELISIATKLSTDMENGMKEVVQDCNKAIDDCELYWKQTVDSAQNAAHDLSHSEVLDALQRVGCTKNNLVTQPKQDYQAIIKRANKLVTEFSNIAKKLKQSGEAIKEADRQAGGNFN